MRSYTGTSGFPAREVAHSRIRAAGWRSWGPYLCLLPASGLIALFVAYPVATVFYYSLQQYDVTRPYLNGFVGLDNFRQVLTADDVFRTSLAVSVKWVG